MSFDTLYPQYKDNQFFLNWCHTNSVNPLNILHIIVDVLETVKLEEQLTDGKFEKRHLKMQEKLDSLTRGIEDHLTALECSNIRWPGLYPLFDTLTQKDQMLPII